MEEQNQGPLSKAYDVTSLHYKLAYHAFNVLDDILQSKPGQAASLALELGVSEEEMFAALEELYTDNADPDNFE